jgi:hypothetical protein
MSINPTSSTEPKDYIIDIPFVNALEKSNIYNCIRDAVILKIQKIPQLQSLRLNVELTLLVCNIIENSINNNSKHHKIDKKQLVVDILQPPFNLNTQEQQQLKDQIDFLYNNHQIVKLSGLKKAVNSISGWFKKKVSLS